MTLALDAIPPRWEEVTPEWMTDAVSRHHPGARVDQVTVAFSDEGNNRRARFQLHYAKGTGPEYLFAKSEGNRFRAAHAKNGNLFNEADLFASGAPIPVAHPRPYKVVIDRDGLDYVVVMADITREGGVPLDAEATLTVEQARNGVRGMARWHGACWDLAPDHPQLSWLKDWTSTAGFMEAITPAIGKGKIKAAGQLPVGIEALEASEIGAMLVRVLTSFTTGPQTLLHGDAHVGNLYLLPGNDIGFLDWQATRRGNWSQDLGYFFVSALTIEDRQAHEDELLALYRDNLGLAADRLPAMDEIKTRYAASMAYALPIWIATYNSAVTQSPIGSLRLCQRYGQAFVDLDTPGALAKLGV